MTIRPRILLLILAAVLAALIAGCGGSGGGGDSADEGTSVDDLLTKTFSGTKKVESGKLDLSLGIDIQGSSDSQLQGPISLKLSGPFQTQGKGELPEFDMDASFEGAGQNLKAGLTSTGDKGFVNFQGTEYEVSDQVFQQFKTGYEQAQKQSKKKNGDEQSLATLGIDPRRWLTNAKNEGETKVGDTEVIKITGGVDVNKLLDDVNSALEKARGLGVQGSERASREAHRGAEEAGRRRDQEPQRRDLHGQGRHDPAPHGREDGRPGARRLLRQRRVRLADARLLAAGPQRGPGDQGARPARSRSTSCSASSAASAASAARAAARSGGGASGGGASAEDLQKYSDCVQQAGGDNAKVAKCADLLSP